MTFVYIDVGITLILLVSYSIDNWFHPAAQNAPYLHHNQKSPRIFCHQTASGHPPPLPMGICWHWYFVTLVICTLTITDPARNAHYHTITIFSSSFLSSATVRSAPTTPYRPHIVISILWHLYTSILISQILPEMHQTYTTTRILFEFSVLSHRPDSSHHSL